MSRNKTQADYPTMDYKDERMNAMGLAKCILDYIKSKIEGNTPFFPEWSQVGYIYNFVSFPKPREIDSISIEATMYLKQLREGMVVQGANSGLEFHIEQCSVSNGTITSSSNSTPSTLRVKVKKPKFGNKYNLKIERKRNKSESSPEGYKTEVYLNIKTA